MPDGMVSVPPGTSSVRNRPAVSTKPWPANELSPKIPVIWPRSLMPAALVLPLLPGASIVVNAPWE
jgi:hypothetical protein